MKMEVPKEIYEIIDYINGMKHPKETKELFFAVSEGRIKEGDNRLEGSDLLGGEGFALTDISGRN